MEGAGGGDAEEARATIERCLARLHYYVTCFCRCAEMYGWYNESHRMLHGEDEVLYDGYANCIDLLGLNGEHATLIEVDMILAIDNFVEDKMRPYNLAQAGPEAAADLPPIDVPPIIAQRARSRIEEYIPEVFDNMSSLLRRVIVVGWREMFRMEIDHMHYRELMHFYGEFSGIHREHSTDVQMGLLDSIFEYFIEKARSFILH